MLRRDLLRAAAASLLSGLVPPVRADDRPTFPRELIDFVPYPHNPVFTAGPRDAWDARLRERGWILREIAVDAQGRIDAADWQAVRAARPALVSVMLANNETGVLQDIAALAAEGRAAGACFHTDAA